MNWNRIKNWLTAKAKQLALALIALIALGVGIYKYMHRGADPQKPDEFTPVLPASASASVPPPPAPTSVASAGAPEPPTPPAPTSVASVDSVSSPIVSNPSVTPQKLPPERIKALCSKASEANVYCWGGDGLGIGGCDVSVGACLQDQTEKGVSGQLCAKITSHPWSALQVRATDVATVSFPSEATRGPEIRRKTVGEEHVPCPH